jgi:hypothetical protein
MKKKIKLFTDDEKPIERRKVVEAFTPSGE